MTQPDPSPGDGDDVRITRARAHLDHYGIGHGSSLDVIRDLLAVVKELQSPVLHEETEPPQGCHGYVKLLLSRLPDLPAPEIIIEEDGDLCFDWELGLLRTGSVSLSATGRVGWAALIKDFKGHGHFQMPDQDVEFDAVMQRLAGVHQDPADTGKHLWPGYVKGEHEE